MGWTFIGDIQDSAVALGPAYRSDLFRALVAERMPGENVLYSDLDVYFAKDFSEWDFSENFTYRWGDFSWANSALLFISGRYARRTSSLLAEEVLNGTPALPWFLFTEENCEKFDIRIMPTALFDPLWTRGSVLEGQAKRFFRDEWSERLLKEIENRFLACHWHNEWDTVASKGSAFQALLTKERRIADASTG